jgi:hypothetical protein
MALCYCLKAKSSIFVTILFNILPKFFNIMSPLLKRTISAKEEVQGLEFRV